jgi:hypothetical protein
MGERWRWLQHHQSSAAAGGEGGTLSAMVVLLVFAWEMVWREKKSSLSSKPNELYPSPCLISYFLHSKTIIFQLSTY